MRKPALALFTLAAIAGPAFAGSVFVPLASNQVVNGTLYRTKVWISNTDAVDRRFSVTFMLHDTDGSALPPDTSGVIVPAGGTVLLTSVAPDGKTGMLQIAGPTPLVVDARLEAMDTAGRVLSSADIPAISLANAMPAGGTAHLVGLENGFNGLGSNFALLNLSRTSAHCTVSLFQPNGTQIAGTANLAVQPLSRRDFDQVLNILGAFQAADVRVDVSCDQQFFTYATALQVGGPQTVFLAPSQALNGILVPGQPSAPGGPASGPGPGPSPSPGAVTLSVPGTFLHAVDGNSYIGYDLPAQPGVPYTKATIDFDLHITHFPSLLFTGVTSFRRPHDQRALRVVYCAIQIVNRNAKTTLDLGVQDVLVKTTGPWTENHSYHLKLIYDLRASNVELDVFDGGVPVYSISGPPQHFDLSANSNPLRVDFGQSGIGDGAYAPPIGWSYSNLNVVVEK